MKKIDKRAVMIAFGVVLGLATIYYVSAIALPRMFVTLTKAAPATKVSLKESRILGERILAKADGKDKNKLNVFVMDQSGKGVQGKSVTVEVSEVNVEKPVAISGMDGKASFDLTSEKEGQFVVRASIEGMPLAGDIVITFRN